MTVYNKKSNLTLWNVIDLQFDIIKWTNVKRDKSLHEMFLYLLILSFLYFITYFDSLHLYFDGYPWDILTS